MSKKIIHDEDAYIFNEARKALNELEEIRKNKTYDACKQWAHKYADLWMEIHYIITGVLSYEIDFSQTSLDKFYDDYNYNTFDLQLNPDWEEMRENDDATDNHQNQ